MSVLSWKPKSPLKVKGIRWAWVSLDRWHSFLLVAENRLDQSLFVCLSVFKFVACLVFRGLFQMIYVQSPAFCSFILFLQFFLSLTCWDLFHFSVKHVLCFVLEVQQTYLDLSWLSHYVSCKSLVMTVNNTEVPALSENLQGTSCGLWGWADSCQSKSCDHLI